MVRSIVRFACLTNTAGLALAMLAAEPNPPLTPNKPPKAPAAAEAEAAKAAEAAKVPPAQREAPTTAGLMPAGALVPTPADTAALRAENPLPVSTSLAATPEDVDALRVPLNRQMAGVDADPTSAASGQDSPISPRAEDSGFHRRMRGDEDRIHGIGHRAHHAPLQALHRPHAEYPNAVAADPYGSRPSFVEPETGQQTYQPTTPEHLAGDDAPSDEADEKADQKAA